MKDRDNDKPARDRHRECHPDCEPVLGPAVPGTPGACDQQAAPTPASLADTAEYLPPPKPAPQAGAKGRNQNHGMTF